MANDHWLQMQVYPLGCVLYWKECVQFLDCLSWLEQIQWLPPGISLERESALAGPMEVPASQQGATSPGHLGVTVLFLTGLVWQQSQGDYLATPDL